MVWLLLYNCDQAFKILCMTKPVADAVMKGESVPSLYALFHVKSDASAWRGYNHRDHGLTSLPRNTGSLFGLKGLSNCALYTGGYFWSFLLRLFGKLKFT